MTKPLIGILFSDNLEDSQESYFLARYIGALLALSGYAEVYLVGLTDNLDIRSSSCTPRLTILHPISGKDFDAPSSDINIGTFSKLSECDVIIVTVNSKDSEFCGKKLSNLFSTSNDKVILFCLQRGVKSSEELSKQLGSKKGLTILEGVVGFAVVPNPKSGVLTSTVPTPRVTLLRLSKEVAAVAEGPLNLLEHTNLSFLYSKSLTVHSWGVLVFESVYALNAVTGGTMADMLRHWRWRVVLSSMIREQCKALTTAARGGRWKPDLSLVVPILTPKMLEMLLVLPGFVLFPLMYLLQFRLPALPSPILVDLGNGRRTSVSSQLEELVDTGKRYQVPMPVSEAILHQIRASEAAGLGVSRVSQPNTPQMMAAVESLVFRSTPPGLVELRFWVIRLVTVFSVVILIWFLLI